jgi:hypothetical protein
MVYSLKEVQPHYITHKAMAPGCSVVGVYQSFGGTRCLQLQDSIYLTVTRYQSRRLRCKGNIPSDIHKAVTRGTVVG